MSYTALARRAGVSASTVQRILGSGVDEASFANVAAVAEALGAPIGGPAMDVDSFRAQAAREKAERIARMVQGTSGLEGQGVDAREFERVVERTFHELMAGSPRRVWSE